MRKMKIAAPAKINLSLDVIRKMSNGYHEMEMIMQEIDLADEIELTLTASGIQCACSDPDLPVNKENIAVRAAFALVPFLKSEKGVQIYLKKNIPHGAGLGGGSADAAAVLKGLNELWELGLTQQQLLRIGVQLGADVPFCIFGGTAHAKGIGERLKRLPDSRPLPILLINPGIHVSTKDVFEALDADQAISHPKTQDAIAAWAAQDYKALRNSAGNRLREVTVQWHPEIRAIEEDLMDQGAVFAMMSGSGPTVFGLFVDETTRDQAYEALKVKHAVVICSRTGRREEFHVED